MRKIELRDQAQISSSTLAIMGQDRKVSMAVLMKICAALECKIDDIMDILPDEPSHDSEVR
ncbi:MAG: helix-turn-helix transcriptional regulator [Victivallaceae bacterium]|nr:helix-turn-helix transcriptional regulator [Victivallaceae bacterium]